ncbi:MAG: ATP-binding cassette domain-containing protein [Blastocatellia bacterium]|nr:ATP-binding cassette domain-containing protein [Blastocatellia bacterium]MCS7157200.1 ATP-binding cassette domain-containing protein [Blastocatellia bacterium]MCX7752337.1 ATP-binding cassette domain-containing protein [Blastocatellia bacterium]MDW8167218.1 ATP-binding cassette domain-containing protein [Acidobacteriota bacterium]
MMERLLSDRRNAMKTPPSPSEDHPVLEFREVSIAFDDPPRRVLDRVSFKVYKGEMRIILGPTGSGKSTILRLAIGLLRPDEGQIFVNGQEITALPEEALLKIRQKIGVVFQEDALFTSLTVAENVAYRLLEQGYALEDVEAEVRRTLRWVGLEHAYGMMPNELSGGMSRRTAIARALVGDPEIILYDSPLAGLDPVIGRRISRLVMRLRDLQGVTSLWITQNMDEVRYLASHFYERTADGKLLFRRESERFCLINTKILMLAEGRVIFDGTDEFFWSARDPMIRQFLP